MRDYVIIEKYCSNKETYMKKRFAIIGAAFMMAFSATQTQAQQQVNMGQNTLSESDIKEQSATSIEQLNKDVELDLSSEQKDRLVTAMVEFNKAQVSLQEEFQEEMTNMEEAFQKSMSDILDSDQRESLEEHSMKQQKELEEAYARQLEEAEKQWEGEGKSE